MQSGGERRTGPRKSGKAERQTYSARAQWSSSRFPSATRLLQHQCLTSAFLLDSSYPFSDYRGEKEKTKRHALYPQRTNSSNKTWHSSSSALRCKDLTSHMPHPQVSFQKKAMHTNISIWKLSNGKKICFVVSGRKGHSFSLIKNYGRSKLDSRITFTLHGFHYIS